MSRQFRNPILTNTWEQLRDACFDLWRKTASHEESATGDLTTSGEVGHEYIYCDETGTGTQTITLSKKHLDLDQVTVFKGALTAKVTDEAGNDVNGTSTDTVTTVTTYVKSGVKGDWRAV